MGLGLTAVGWKQGGRASRAGSAPRLAQKRTRGPSGRRTRGCALCAGRRCGEVQPNGATAPRLGSGRRRWIRAVAAVESRSEAFLKQLDAENEEALREQNQLREERDKLESGLSALCKELDALYGDTFGSQDLSSIVDITCAKDFADLGKQDPETFQKLLEKLQEKPEWKDLQEQSHQIRLKQMRMEERLQQIQVLQDVGKLGGVDDEEDDAMEYQGAALAASGGPAKTTNIVLICGFEAFNLALYKKVSRSLRSSCGRINLRVFSDRDIDKTPSKVKDALAEADVFFGSLVFDYDTVLWLKENVSHIPVRLVFESDLALMGTTQIGTFTMATNEDENEKKKPAGPPPAVKKVLSLFGSSREEDRMLGYLSMLKIGPKLLKFLPGKRVRHLRNWLTIYNYWNQAGADNVTSMVAFLVKEYFPQSLVNDDGSTSSELLQEKEVQEMPSQGVIHPDAPGKVFATPEEYLQWYKAAGPLKDRMHDGGAPRVGILLYRKHVITEQIYVPQLIRQFEQDGLVPIPIFINGVEAHTVVRDLLTTADQSDRSQLKKGYAEVSAVVSTIGFPLVGGPAGSMEAGRQSEISKEILESKNIPYVIAAPLLIQDLESWERSGMMGLQSIVLYALPELDGAIDTVPIGGLVGDNIFLISERVQRLTRRLHKWIKLRQKPKKDRKVAVLLYGFPPGVGATGTAALLNVPQSLSRLLHALKAEGYDTGDKIPSDLEGDALVEVIRALDNPRAISRGAKSVNLLKTDEISALGGNIGAAEVNSETLRDWLTFPKSWGPTEWGPVPFLPEPDVLVQRLEAQWGTLGNPRHISVSEEGNYVVSGVQFGNVWIGVQPVLGVEGDPMRLLFERDLTPHPQYAAFYSWLQNGFQADACIHFGTHGTVEWLPGSPVGNTGLSWSDVLLGNLPNIYIYTANNPSESIIAKRRGYGTIVSHNVPPYGRSGLYKQLASLKELLSDYRSDPQANQALKETIVDTIAAAGLFKDCPYSEKQPKITVSDLGSISDIDFNEFVQRMFTYLQVVENRLFSEGLHVIGNAPDQSGMEKYLSAYFGAKLPADAIARISTNSDATVDQVLQHLSIDRDSSTGGGDPGTHLREDISSAIEIRDLLSQNTEEMRSTVRALSGEYIPSVAGGDLLRDGPSVLPTGRNIHALDPYRMPSESAYQRGCSAAREIIQQHRDQNGGDFPETVAVALWGLDSIKTKGDAVGIVLHLVGAKLKRDSNGKIARFELIPLEEMEGRPRIDVIANMSGIFRDTFQNVVDLLDDLFARAAAAEKPEERNFIRKHTEEMRSQGIDRPASRLFSNPAGDYGSMVNERVGSSNWEDGSELGDTWASRNAFSYGKGGEKGSARPELLGTLLKTTDRVVQEVDSVEYGLTDIQEYYANTGALRKAAETAKSSAGRGDGKVGCSIVECFGEDVSPKELEDVLRLEYRSKLLNPKWAEAMLKQGSGGAYEVSTRITALLGWGATADFAEDWVYDQATDYYVNQEEVAAQLRKANPQAFHNILKRSIEAARRGFWDPDEEQLEKLIQMFNEMDAELEGMTQ